MQIGSVVWEEFDHIHTYIHTYTHTYTRNLANVALSIRVTLNTKPALQVLIIAGMVFSLLMLLTSKYVLQMKLLLPC